MLRIKSVQMMNVSHLLVASQNDAAVYSIVICCSLTPRFYSCTYCSSFIEEAYVRTKATASRRHSKIQISSISVIHEAVFASSFEPTLCFYSPYWIKATRLGKKNWIVRVMSSNFVISRRCLTENVKEPHQIEKHTCEACKNNNNWFCQLNMLICCVLVMVVQ